MSSMSVSGFFEPVVFPLSAALWKASGRQRSFMFHGTSWCPQRVHPFAPQVTETLCSTCSELHQHLLVVADRRIAKWVGDDPRPEVIDRSVTRLFGHAESLTLEARDCYDASRDLVCKVSQLSDRAQWFVDVLPDAVDREVVEQLLFFVRGGDAFHNGAVPVETFARSLDITVDDFVERMSGAIAALRDEKPEWVERNIDRPLSERLSESDGPLDEAC